MAYWPHLLLLVFILVLWFLDHRFPKAVDRAEENLLIFALISIMLVAFGQVVARYGFNTGWSAALEYNTVAFSWLILMGMSFGIKHGSHLGVDIVLNSVSAPVGKFLSLLGAVGCMIYGLVLLDSTWVAALGIDVRGGAIEYWAKMYKVGIGAEELRYPAIFAEWFDLNTRDMRVDRWLILLILPISLAMLVFRSLQAFVAIWTGQRHHLISGHEAQDLVDENKDVLKD